MSPKSQQDAPKLESRGSPAPGDPRLPSRKQLCAGLVDVGREPASVADLAVRALRARMVEIWRAGGQAAPDWAKGERVVIRHGLFEGYQAILDTRMPGSAR